MNKPLGVTCSHKETGPLVYRLLPDRWRLRDPAISTVGRLDKDTSGLLLLTDDGALLHKIISPRRQIAKTYRATLDRPCSGDEAEIFAAGTLMLEGEDKPLLPARLEILGPTRGAAHDRRGPLSSGPAHVRRRRQSCRRAAPGFGRRPDACPTISRPANSRCSTPPASRGFSRPRATESLASAPKSNISG